MRRILQIAVLAALLADSTRARAEMPPAQTPAERQATICAAHRDGSDEADHARIKDVPSSQMTREQHDVADRMAQGPRGCVFGPFAVMLHSPRLLAAVQQVGVYLRYDGVLAPRLRELAILAVGRELDQPYIWYVHEPIARSYGVGADTIAALASKGEVSGLGGDDHAVLTFATHLLRTHTVSPALFEDVKARFGEQGVVELTGLVSYFSMLGLQLNVAGMPTPGDYPAAFATTKVTR